MNSLMENMKMPVPAQAVRHRLLNTFFSRYSVWFSCIFITLTISWFRIIYEPQSIHYFLSDPFLNSLWLISGILTLVGVYDILQNQHSILKNYPLIGHFRFIFEEFRPEIRQYFIENDQDALPFSRMQRSLVYRRAKNKNADKPFGSLIDVYQQDYRFITHSITPCKPADPESFRIQIGNHQCRQPYSASIMNISALSFGSLSANAIRALNLGAKMGNFYHDTGEGSISPLPFGKWRRYRLGTRQRLLWLPHPERPVRSGKIFPPSPITANQDDRNQAVSRSKTGSWRNFA